VLDELLDAHAPLGGQDAAPIVYVVCDLDAARRLHRRVIVLRVVFFRFHGFHQWPVYYGLSNVKEKFYFFLFALHRQASYLLCMKRKGLNITLEQAIEHQRKHGFAPPVGKTLVEVFAAEDAPTTKLRGGSLPNKTETEFGWILEARKRKGEIVRYEFEGIRLRWGVDKETGVAMWYKPDWFVVEQMLPQVAVNRVGFIACCIEIKGAKIWDRDIVRFKGARAAWPEFAFEMWQKDKGLWNRIA
jgi:hypothetical protein